MYEQRPDPDALLKFLQTEEKKSKKGRLKIFLGMSAGVGKTYAMLEDAQNRAKEGVDVVVGTVNTHGRKETAGLLEGLKIIPEKWIKYKDTVFEELDLDEILKIKPQLVLVDELAHSNVSGSRHPKRWQDVMEILDAGIDVYTTLNIQHIESRRDLIENIAGISIRETVPDIIIDTASEIKLIDISPQELLQRLKEGKVYLGTQSEIAARNFFQEDRLAALREVVMRLAAEKVDHDLHEMITSIERKQSWKPHEKFMVAINHSPHSQKLIRTTRRLAFHLDAPWIAVHIDTGVPLDAEEQEMLSKNLALARELGAEVITTQDPDIALTLERIARQKSVTQIIIGRSPKRPFWDFFNRFSMVDRLVTEINDIDVHIIRQVPFGFPKPKIRLRRPAFKSSILSYLGVALFVLALTSINWFLSAFVNYRIIGLFFLLGTLFLSLFFRPGPIIFGVLLSAVIWDYLFIPPIHAFVINTSEDEIIGTILFLITGTVTAILTSRARARQEMLLKREVSTQAIYEIVKEIATAPSTKHILTSIKERLGKVLNGTCELLIKQIDNGLIFESDSPLLQDEKERAVAEWVFENGKEAGWTTNTLPSAKSLYIPLKGFREIVGVLRFQPKLNKELSPEELNFLYTVILQLSNYLERTFAEERERRKEQINQIEKIYESILNSISREFQRPLNNIQEGIKELKHEKVMHQEKMGTKSIRKIESSSKNLSRIVENITAMSKLSSSLIPSFKEPCDVKDLILVCCDLVRNSLKNQELKTIIPDNLPLVMMDFALIQILICNLLFNAIDFSPPNSTIEIEVKKTDENLIVAVSDEGKGIPAHMANLIFEKFYKLPGTESSGVGLGLAVAKAIAETHQGKLKVENREVRGSRFSLYLPLT